MKLTIVYDNVEKNGLKADWGFSAFIETNNGKKILFDAGERPEILKYNIEKLGILHTGDVIEHVIISHAHHDHIGGLSYVFSAYDTRNIWIPDDAVIPGLPDQATVYRGREGWVEEGVYLLKNLPSRAMLEQSLLLIGKHKVLLVGCNHPGLYAVLEQVKNRMGDYPDWVIGGLHLYRMPGHVIEKMWNDLRYKLKKVAPLHCSGDRARRRLSLDWKEGYLPVGLGDSVEI